jgi:hypothetical protein
MGDKLCLAVCHHFEREAAAVLDGFEDVILAVFPSHCGRPPLQWAELNRLLPPVPGNCTQGIVIGSCCLANLKDPPPELESWRLHRLEVCQELLLNRSILQAYLREGSYLVTPGWLAHWEDQADEWGFDPETARDFFRESASHLLLMDTGIDDRSADRLAGLAAFAGLPFQIVPVGLDFMSAFLVQFVLEWRLAHQKATSNQALSRIRQQLADDAMVFDLVGRLGKVNTEAQVMADICQLFTTLCAPARLIYTPLAAGAPSNILAQPAATLDTEALPRDLVGVQESYAWLPSGRGFRLRIGDRDETLGVLEVDEIAFPEYREHYVNLALSIVDICVLAIHNARIFSKLEKTLDDLVEAQGKIKILKGFLPICASCKKIRDDQGYWNQIEAYIQTHSEAEFTHGVCPECAKRLYPDFFKKKPE